MAGFLRRVAGAFIEVEPTEKGATRPGRASDPDLDKITRGAAEHLAALESTQSAESSGRTAPRAAHEAAAESESLVDMPPPPVNLGADLITGFTAEQVFARSGPADGTHTAPRILRIEG
jgi:hypothetical protein